MRSLRYLNGVLTIIAVLLTLNLWTMWTGNPSLGIATTAQAAGSSAPVGVPNAANQRVELLDAQREMTRKVEELVSLFKSGQARVRVEGAKTDK